MLHWFVHHRLFHDSNLTTANSREMRQLKVVSVGHYLTIRAFFHSVELIVSVRSHVSKLSRRDAEVYTLDYRPHKMRTHDRPVLLYVFLSPLRP